MTWILNSLVVSNLACSVTRRQIQFCFEPSQPQRITSGLNINFNLARVIHSTSHYTTNRFHFFLFRPNLKFYPQFRNAKPEKQ